MQDISKAFFFDHECFGAFDTKQSSDIADIKVNSAQSILRNTVHLPLYLTQLSLLLRGANKLCLQLSVKVKVVPNIMGGELYISLYLEQNSPLVLAYLGAFGERSMNVSVHLIPKS